MAEAGYKEIEMLKLEVNNLEKIKKFALDLFFPVFCFGCGREGKYICEKCEGFVGEAAFICPLCQQSSFTGERHEQCRTRYGLDGLVGIWEYEGLVKKCISQIKYQRVTHAIVDMVARAFGVMAQNFQMASPFLSFLLSEHTSITYVPMTKSKEKKRGFNQAALIAQALGTIIRSSTDSFIDSSRDSSIGSSTSSSRDKTPQKLLQKIKDTKSQTELDKKERLENVKGSFAVSNTGGTLSVPLTTLSVVLVDDVWTTGATMRECCKVLKKAGVEKVWGFTLARTV